MATTNLSEVLPVEPPSAINTWDRQPGEPWEVYSAFCDYRKVDGLEDTRLDFVAQKYCIQISDVRALRAKFFWMQRREAYLVHCEEVNQRIWEDERRSMLKRHAEVGQEVINKAMARLRQIDLDEITAKDLVALLDAGIKTERQSRGAEDRSSNPLVQVINSSQSTENTNQKIVLDSKSSELACDLLKSIAGPSKTQKPKAKAKRPFEIEIESEYASGEPK